MNLIAKARISDELEKWHIIGQHYLEKPDEQINASYIVRIVSDDLARFIAYYSSMRRHIIDIGAWLLAVQIIHNNEHKAHGWIADIPVTVQVSFE